MYKRILYGVIGFIFLLSLAGCQPAAPTETEIQDYLGQIAGDYIGETVEITQVEIEKRATDKNIDMSYCNVLAEGKTASYNMYFVVEYHYYDKGGWLLESLSIDRQDEWTARYNADNLRTIEDLALEKEKIYISGLDKDEMVFSWNSDGVFFENNKYIQYFSGSATFSNEICKIDVPVLFYYTFENYWIGSVFCADWQSAYKQRAGVSDCMELDMSGVWVGNTKAENLRSSLNKYVDRNQYTGNMKLTLKVDDDGYPYGKMETVVPYIDVFTSTVNKKYADKSIDLGCREIKYAGTEDYSVWYNDFDLYGDGNDNLMMDGALIWSSTIPDRVGLIHLKLDPINKILSGEYFRTYGTRFDVELQWMGKE